MVLKSPIVTLLSGVVIAAVITTLSVNAGRKAKPYEGAPSAPTASASATPAPSDRPVTITRGTYVGKSTADDGTRISVAIVIRDGRALAYLCSGKIESWLTGTAANGRLTLTGTHRATLDGQYRDADASGVAVLGGRRFPFTLSLAVAPSALWRSAQRIRDKLVVAGWIIQPDGSEVGMVDFGGVESAAPHLDPSAPTVAVNGTTIAATQVDGVTANGF